MERSLSIAQSTFEDGVVLALAGEVDVASVRALQDALRDVDLAPPREVWIDLSDVGFIDSTGLTTIVLAHRRLDQRVRRLALICPAGQIRRVLAIAGIDRVMPVHASLDEARALT